MTKTQVKGNDTLLWININGFYVNNYFKYFTFSSTFYWIFKSKVKFRFVYCLCSWQYSVLTCLKPPKHYFELILYMYMFPECFNFDMRKVISLEITYLTIYFPEISTDLKSSWMLLSDFAMFAYWTKNSSY